MFAILPVLDDNASLSCSEGFIAASGTIESCCCYCCKIAAASLSYSISIQDFQEAVFNVSAKMTPICHWQAGTIASFAV